MRILTLLCALMLVGCSQNISGKPLKIATEMCASHGGLLSIRTLDYHDNYDSYKCADGLKVMIDNYGNIAQ